MVVETDLSVFLRGQQSNLVQRNVAFCKLMFWEPLSCSFPKPIWIVHGLCTSQRSDEHLTPDNFKSCRADVKFFFFFVPLTRRWLLLTSNSLLYITKGYFSSNTFEDSVNYRVAFMMSFNRVNEQKFRMCRWLKTTRDFTESQLQLQWRFIKFYASSESQPSELRVTFHGQPWLRRS